MEINLSDFHFLRPAWLLLAIVGALLPLVWRRSHDQQRRLRAIIAPHLLPHLLVTPPDNHRLRPVHLTAALLMIGAVAGHGCVATRPAAGRRKPPAAARPGAESGSRRG